MIVCTAVCAVEKGVLRPEPTWHRHVRTQPILSFPFRYYRVVGGAKGHERVIKDIRVVFDVIVIFDIVSGSLFSCVADRGVQENTRFSFLFFFYYVFFILRRFKLPPR